MIRFKKFSDDNLKGLLEDAENQNDVVVSDSEEGVVWVVRNDEVAAVGFAQEKDGYLVNVILKSGSVIVGDSFPKEVGAPTQEDNVHPVDFGGPQEGEWGPA